VPASVFARQKKVRFPRRLDAVPSMPIEPVEDRNPRHLAAAQKPPS